MENRINEDGYFGKDFQVQFYGWSSYNSLVKDFSDEIENCREVLKSLPLKVDDRERIKSYMSKAKLVLINRCAVKGIKFSGSYHQNGAFGTPLFRVIDERSDDVYDRIFKWTCTFRYWGEIMETAGHGITYMDWAWDDCGEPVYPNQIEGENCVATEN